MILKLIGFWWLSVAVAWGFRLLVIRGWFKSVAVLPVEARFEAYSAIEAVSRGFQGTLFWVCIGALMVRGMFTKLMQDSQGGGE